MSATLVGDPGAEEYFQGVALTRCKGTVTPEDEATAEHLVDELKKLATKMGRLLACLRLTTTCGGGQEALVDVKRRIKVGEHEGGQPRYRERSMTEPFVARVTGVGPDSDTVFAHIVPPPFRGNEAYYGDGPDGSSFRLRVKLPFVLYRPVLPVHRRHHGRLQLRGLIVRGAATRVFRQTPRSSKLGVSPPQIGCSNTTV